MGNEKLANKEWKIGVLLSSEGFEGVQFFTVTFQARERILSILPRLHHIFMQLDTEIKGIDMGDQKNESEDRNCS